MKRNRLDLLLNNFLKFFKRIIIKEKIKKYPMIFVIMVIIILIEFIREISLNADFKFMIPSKILKL